MDMVRLSKMASHALRHEPWVYELELDEEGWVGVEALLRALREERGFEGLTVEDLERMVETGTKRRHEISGGRVRALYGHSVPGKLKKEVGKAPAVLFHGTSPGVVEVIRREGLKPMGRQYVHLSVDRETAEMVGRRKAEKPVILVVRASEAEGKGVRFYEGNEKVWLAEGVPGEFIE